MAYVTPEMIEKAREMDLLTYLANYEPNELVPFSDGIYTTKEHDSVKISNGKWFQWSTGIGGVSALDYLVKVRNVPFTEAVLLVLGQTAMAPPQYVPQKKTDKQKHLILPNKSRTATRVVKYLVNERGIDEEIVRYCIKNGCIYESLPYHNAVFVGYDGQHNPRYAAFRATNQKRIMGDCSGSDKAYSFRLIGDEHGEIIHIFECAIDLLSYATLMNQQGKEWRMVNLISLSGVYQPKKEISQSKLPAAIIQYLEEHPQVKKVYLHLDNDKAGRIATQIFKIKLPKEIVVIDRKVPKGKDVNDYLLSLNKPPILKNKGANNMDDKVYSLIVKPRIKPHIITVEDNTEAIKKLIGGEFERISVPSDEVTLFVCKDGKEQNKPENRAVCVTNTEEKEMSYSELTSLFRQSEREGKHITGYIKIAAKGNLAQYSADSLTYGVSSNNKAFIDGMGGYSIYASSIDGSDFCVRLENYLKDERGGKNGWEIERCFIKEETPIIDRKVYGNFLVCHSPKGNDGRLSDITQDIINKYFEMFKSSEKDKQALTGKKKHKENIER